MKHTETIWNLFHLDAVVSEWTTREQTHLKCLLKKYVRRFNSSNIMYTYACVRVFVCRSLMDILKHLFSGIMAHSYHFKIEQNYVNDESKYYTRMLSDASERIIFTFVCENINLICDWTERRERERERRAKPRNKNKQSNSRYTNIPIEPLFRKNFFSVNSIVSVYIQIQYTILGENSVQNNLLKFH